ncbi:MAG: SCO family protein [Myxococcota bacterium]
MKTMACVMCLGLMTCPLSHAKAESSGNPNTSAPPGILTKIGIDQKIGSSVAADLTFRDAAGRTVRIGDYFGQRPVILALAYYQCPSLCTLVLNGVLRAVNAMNLRLGEDYTIITVSIDPSETAALARDKQAAYTQRLLHPTQHDGWHFLVGEPSQIDALAQAVGFRYAKDETTGQFAHAAGIMVLTPERIISRYLIGVEYSARQLRFALVEASQGSIGSVVDAALLYCFRYDPAQGKYSLAIMNVLRLAAVLTAVLILGFIIVMTIRDRRRLRAHSHVGPYAKGGTP